MTTPNQSLLQYNLRDELQKLVVADLLGPANGPEEIVDELEVRGRYLVGLLAPKGQSALPDDSLAERDLAGEYDEDPVMATADGEEDGFEGQVTPAAFNLLPSSLGLTFSLAAETETLRITARWGQYKRVRLQEERFKKEDGSYRSVWQRYPHEGQIVIPLTEDGFAPWSPDPLVPDVYVQGRVRRRDHRWTVTLFLVNGQQEGAPKDEFWLFSLSWQSMRPTAAPSFTVVCSVRRLKSRSRKQWPCSTATRWSLPSATASPSTPSRSPIAPIAPCALPPSSCLPTMCPCPRRPRWPRSRRWPTSP